MRRRQRDILDHLERQGACSYQELTELLGVSTMTVRRDIDELANQGHVIKTLGGAQIANAPSRFYETTLRNRVAEHRQEKRCIAQLAAELIRPKQTIFLDGSTTCLELAAQLIRVRTEELTIVSNSVLVAMELGQNKANMVVGLGGQYDPDSASYVGPTAEESATRFFVDLAFVSTKGFVPAEGTFESSISNFRIKQMIARQCSELVLLADHSKFGQRALCKVLDIAQISSIVTDSQTDEAELNSLRKMGKQVHVASLEPDSPCGVANA